MTEEQINEQIETIREVSKKACQSKAMAIAFLKDMNGKPLTHFEAELLNKTFPAGRKKAVGQTGRNLV